jgi:hypothetical protein
MSHRSGRIEHMNEDSVHPTPDLEPTGDQAADAALKELADAVAAVNQLDLTALVRLDQPSSGLHAVARNVELLRRRLAVFDAAYVAAGAWPTRPSCASSSRPPRASRSGSAALRGSPPSARPAPSPPETAAAPSPAATGHRVTARDTTSTTGPTTDPPTSTTSPCSAATTTASSKKRGWECVMLKGLPHWRPPAWLDPHRTPIRNTRHHTRPDPLPDTG